MQNAPNHSPCSSLDLMPARRTGVLLVNTGTPDQPTPDAVGRYLVQFLSDPRVVDIHPILRWLLVHVLIVPRRKVTSAAAYRAIWSDAGSPLWVHSRALQQSLSDVLGPTHHVEMAMRYGQPSIVQGLHALMQHHVHEIVVVPLFPQYASAATGSVAEEVFRALGTLWNTPPVRVVGAFYDHPQFIGAVTDQIRTAQQAFNPDHILFSYHGLPERHIHKSGCQTSANASSACDLQAPCPAMSEANGYCYRAQCYATTRLIAEKLPLSADSYTVAFQSRLGRTPWIKPYSDHILPTLIARGHKRLAVACPSFVADCLETVEEVGIRAKDAWRALGGDALHLIPCVNHHPEWVQGLAHLIGR